MTGERDTDYADWLALASLVNSQVPQADQLIRKYLDNDRSGNVALRAIQVRALEIRALELATHVRHALANEAAVFEWEYLQSAHLRVHIEAPGEAVVTSEIVHGPAEDIDKLSARVARKGFAGLSPLQILVIVLIVLAFAGLPVAELKLSPELQELASNEPGYIALAVAITSVIIKSDRKKPPSG